MMIMDFIGVNNPLNIFINIVFYFIAIKYGIALIILIIEFLHVKYMRKKVKNTYELFNKNVFGWIMGISGKIGAGKTILLSAISNTLTKIIKRKLKEDIRKMTSIFYQINYNLLNQKIDCLAQRDCYVLVKTNEPKEIVVIDYIDNRYTVTTKNLNYNMLTNVVKVLLEVAQDKKNNAPAEYIAEVNSIIKNYDLELLRFCKLNYRYVFLKLLDDQELIREVLMIAPDDNTLSFAEMQDIAFRLGYNDGFLHRGFREYLRKYVRAYTRLKNEYFVMSNVQIQNRTTNNTSKKLKSEYLHPKHKNTPLEYGLIVVEDENSIEDSNVNTHQIKKDDTGKDTLMKLGRNAFEELLYMLLASQNFNRIVKLYREVANSNIFINGFKVVEVYKSRKRKIRFKQKLLNMFIRLYFARHQRYWRNSDAKDEFYNTNSHYKRKNFKLFDKENKLYSQSYIVFNVITAFNVNDDNADGRSRRTMKLYFRLDYAFSVDTHEYKYFAERMIELSKTSFEEILTEQSAIVQQQIIDADNMLKKEHLKEKDRRDDIKIEMMNLQDSELRLAEAALDTVDPELEKRSREWKPGRSDRKKINKWIYSKLGIVELDYEEKKLLWLLQGNEIPKNPE